jgi:hypothetical protein
MAPRGGLSVRSPCQSNPNLQGPGVPSVGNEGLTVGRPVCTSLRKDGSPCRGPSLPGSDRCWVHDPEQAERTAEARARGAVKAAKLRSLRGRRSRLVTVPELLRFNAEVVHRAISGELPPDLARVAIYGLTLQRALIESGDLAKRLEALEQRLAEQGTRKWA